MSLVQQVVRRPWQVRGAEEFVLAFVLAADAAAAKCLDAPLEVDQLKHLQIFSSDVVLHSLVDADLAMKLSVAKERIALLTVVSVH